MGGSTFEEMFKKRFPVEKKRVETFEELVDNFRNWSCKPVVTLSQREALWKEARKMHLRGIPNS